MKIVIPRELARKLQFFASHSREVSGAGLVEFKDDTAYIRSLDAIPSSGGAAHTRIPAEALGVWLAKQPETAGTMPVLWWHTHPRMAAFWSGTDSATIKEQAAEGVVVALVANEKGDMRGAFGGRTAPGAVLVDDNVTVAIEGAEDIPVSWRQELAGACLPEPERGPWRGTFWDRSSASWGDDAAWSREIDEWRKPRGGGGSRKDERRREYDAMMDVVLSRAISGEQTLEDAASEASRWVWGVKGLDRNTRREWLEEIASEILSIARCGDASTPATPAANADTGGGSGEDLPFGPS